jgi:uncharacterized membrane protein YsdA (DUF1294 family)
MRFVSKLPPVLAILWLLSATGCLIASGLEGKLTGGLAAVAYSVAVLMMSGWAFVAYGWDKRQATRQKRRISERYLQTLAALGGWPGAILGSRYFRHKTQKLAFRVVLAAITVGHLTLAVSWGWYLQTR